MNNTNPLRKPELLAQELGEEMLLVDADGSTVHVLNPTARFIWERCDGQCSATDIARALQASFSVGPERDVEAHVLRTLEVFAAKGLLRGEELNGSKKS